MVKDASVRASAMACVMASDRASQHYILALLLSKNSGGLGQQYSG